MSTEIRRRSLPDSLRWLADKLDSETVTEAEWAGAAITLHTLADQAATRSRGHCRPGRCMGLACCSYECSQGRCLSAIAAGIIPAPE